MYHMFENGDRISFFELKSKVFDHIQSEACWVDVNFVEE